MTTKETAPAPKPGGGSALKQALPIIIVVVLLGGFFATGAHRYFAPDRLFTTLEGLRTTIEANLLLSVLAFTLLYAGLVAISFPGATILTIAGGFLFGQWIGTVSVVLGATAGAIAIFFMAKTAFGDTLASKAGGFVKKMEEGFREGELSYMFLLRVVPAFPFFAVNIAAGLLNVKLRNYAIGTFFGIIPGTAVYVSIGNAIRAGTKTLDDAGLTQVFTQPQIYIPFIGLALLGALPVVIKKLTGKKVGVEGDV